MPSEQNKQLVIASFLQREADIPHHTYDEELLQYEYLKNGDLRAVEESKKFFRSETMGKLSTDMVRNKKYLFVATTTLATRFAIEGGLEAQTAYNLSDYYIRQMDLRQDVPEINELHTEMITDFTNLFVLGAIPENKYLIQVQTETMENAEVAFFSRLRDFIWKK